MLIGKAEKTVTSVSTADADSITVRGRDLCGDLMGRLQRHLAPRMLASTAQLGIDPDWVEAAAFAWLAQRTMQGLAGNAPAVTGAAGERVLGAIYPA